VRELSEALDATMQGAQRLAETAVQEGARLTEAAVKKAWTIMDAASEKRAPTEYLSQSAVKRIQGQ